MHVDETRNDIETRGIDYTPCRGIRQLAQSYDLIAADPHIRSELGASGSIQDQPVANEYVEVLSTQI